MRGAEPVFNFVQNAFWQADSRSQGRGRLTTGYAQLFADVQIPLELLYGGLHVGVFLHFPLDRFRRVDNSRVITAAEFVADGWERSLGVFAAEIHGDLAW